MLVSIRFGFGSVGKQKNNRNFAQPKSSTFHQLLCLREEPTIVFINKASFLHIFAVSLFRNCDDQMVKPRMWTRRDHLLTQIFDLTCFDAIPKYFVNKTKCQPFHGQCLPRPRGEASERVCCCMHEKETAVLQN